MGQCWRHRLLVQTFSGGRDHCGLCGHSRVISRASGQHRGGKPLAFTMRLPRKRLCVQGLVTRHAPWQRVVYRSKECLPDVAVGLVETYHAPSVLAGHPHSLLGDRTTTR
jgi:hypothetical protein